MKKEFYFLIILILIFITGCSGLSQTQNNEPRQVTGAPNGIQIQFLSAPINFQEGDRIPVPVQLTNNAACDVNGKLCLTDTASSTRGGIVDPICQGFSINGATIGGSKKDIPKTPFYVETPSYFGIDDRPGGFETTIQATATYNCNLVAGPILCITNQFSGTVNNDCPLTQTITGSNLRASVGPVTISQVKKTLTPGGGLIVEITFKKMSDGYISNTANIDNPILSNQEDPINILIDLSGNTMTCRQDNDFRDNKLYWKNYDNLEKTITCSTSVDFAERVDEPLNIRMDYVYKITESKKITINQQITG